MRLLNRLYAWWFGYFWLPCPVCNREFGGHEAGFASIIAADGHAYCICSDPQCNHDAAVINQSNGHPSFIRSYQGKT